MERNDVSIKALFFLFFVVQTPADRVRLKHLEGEKE